MGKQITFYDSEDVKIHTVDLGDNKAKFVMQDGSLSNEDINSLLDLGLAVVTTPENTYKVEVE